jgi:hypothetical protein
LAACAPALRLEELPDAARAALFRCLSRYEAARASCVSRAWHRAFASGARALWAAPDFTDGAQFDDVFDAACEQLLLRLRPLRVTPALVRGACAKARDSLHAVMLPAHLAPLLPALRLAHPALRRMTLAAPPAREADVHAPRSRPKPTPDLAPLLSLPAPPLFELHVEAFRPQFPPSAEELAQLCRPEVSLLRLHVQRHVVTGGSRFSPLPERFVPQLCSLLRAHAPTLLDVTLQWGGMALPEGSTSDAAEALCACAALRRLHLGSESRHDSWAHVWVSLRAASALAHAACCCCCCSRVVRGARARRGGRASPALRSQFLRAAVNATKRKPSIVVWSRRCGRSVV